VTAKNMNSCRLTFGLLEERCADAINAILLTFAVEFGTTLEQFRRSANSPDI